MKCFISVLLLISNCIEMRFVILLTFVLVNHHVDAAWLKCPNGTDIYSLGITEEGIKEVIEAHNYYRGLATKGLILGQPRATNMKIMKYDKELGLTARSVSMSCETAHNLGKDKRWSWVGQNIHWSWNTNYVGRSQNWTEAVSDWFAEVQFYHYPGNADEVVGHYTQLMWANSEYVGCDFVLFRGYQEGHLAYTKMYTCNYGPGGNYQGRAPYKTNDTTW